MAVVGSILQAFANESREGSTNVLTHGQNKGLTTAIGTVFTSVSHETGHSATKILRNKGKQKVLQKRPEEGRVSKGRP